MLNESFLRTYAHLNEGTEIPGIFAIWSGLAALSAALGRRCWIDMETYIIYPNLYIFLIASSGRCRKSTAVGIAEKLLYQIEPAPNIIAQKITPEGLIDALKLVQTNDSKVFLKESCVGFVIADELCICLNKKTYEAGLSGLFISLYDCKDHFAYHTKGRGKEVLADSCLGILAATTIDRLKDAIPKEAVGEGLTSRVILVYCAKPAKPVSRTLKTKERGELQEYLIKTLQKVLTLEGVVTLDSEAWEYYDKNYNDFYYNSSFYNLPTLAGYASRRHVHMLKIALLFAISERMELKITKKDLIGADEILSVSEASMPMLMNIITSSEEGILMQEVYDVIKEAKCISRKTLLNKFSHKMDLKHFQSIIETLVHSGRVIMEVRGNEIFFVAVV